MAGQITMKPKGLDKARMDIKRFTDEKAEGVKKVLLKTGFKVELSAKEFCTARFKEPTGILMSSITTDKSDLHKNVVRVGTNKDYAPYVEHGHRQTPGRFVPAIGKRLVVSFVQGKPYLYPAFFMHEGGIEKDLKREFKKVK